LENFELQQLTVLVHVCRQSTSAAPEFAGIEGGE